MMVKDNEVSQPKENSDSCSIELNDETDGDESNTIDNLGKEPRI